MDYERQLEEFYSKLNYNPLSTNAMALYQAILYIAHIAKRIDELSIANTRLMSICRLTIKELQSARNELIIKEYMKYKKGRNQNEAPKYSVTILYEVLKSKKDSHKGRRRGKQ